MFKFDPDALLAALPFRAITPFPSGINFRSRRERPEPPGSSLHAEGAYNGFSHNERYRTADLSKWLARAGSTLRPSECDICGNHATDEHAENYYDLSSWIGLCRKCHRTVLHNRFARPSRWRELLDQNCISDNHWSRLVSDEPFDIAALLRSRGIFEPEKANFAPQT